MNLQDIQYKSLYIVPHDNYVEEVLVSSLRLSTSLDCMFGFFGSDALKTIAPGLAEYLARTEEPMRLVVSPNISEKDMIALREGVTTPSIVLETRLEETISTLTEEFDALWNRSRDYVVSLDLPVAIENDLIREYTPEEPPTTDDFKKA